MTFGGLDEASMSPPTEARSDFRSGRWGPTELGNFFEVTKNGVRIRPENTESTAQTAARMYMHTPGIEASPEFVQKNQIKLWVNEIVIGWGMSYTEAQTVYGKSFYPRHIRYNNVIVRGQTASQRHYDEIVSKVVRMQEEALFGTSDVVRFELPRLAYARDNGGFKPVASQDSFRTRYANVSFDGYLLGIAAGHRKGVFNPDFELQFAVVAYPGDHLHKASSTRSIPELVEGYRKSLSTKTSGSIKPDQVFEAGYGPGGNQGPR